ncbi:DNA-binding SARP family transcriptional activator [Streptomyces sp. 1114.5]|uniref:AfsR/SARP family transcriptional regulator n=1 Tax=Streptomyces sp. 1114.5 TaxID=1938830 RepID=UPI000F19A94A|nr:BTAD domain-containing putative transcriptional regulator [Streptomyces sp. 1114.5]RKT16291.1 DNA-binding SARP family transcriptional activator [Streptomyces sp. 1114.5]
MRLEFRVLGPLRARCDDREVELGRPQQRAVLAALLLSPGQLVPTERLVEGLWGEDDTRWPKDPVGQIGTHAHRLRRALGAPGLLVAAAGGYRLAVPRESVDLFRYEAAVAEAVALRHQDPVRARELLVAALGAWEGDRALDGVPGAFAERARERLAAGRFAAVKALLDLDVVLGRHTDAVEPLAALAASHPQDEEVHRLRLLALHRCGRTAEALAVYEELRERLDRELGLEPAAAVVELADRIRRGQPPVPLRRLPRPGQLPPDIPDLVGRAALARQAERVLRTAGGAPAVGSPVVGLSGPAGSGTSALAVHVAHAVQDGFPDGQLYTKGGEPGAALAAFLRALGERPADGAPADELSAHYRAALAGRRVLVVLDGVADPTPLLPLAAGCAAVVTGADPGVLPVDAVRLAVGPLEPHDAHELLARIVGVERISREPAAAAELAGLCGYLPVLLRTAATRLAARPWWSVADLVRWFTERG